MKRGLEVQIDFSGASGRDGARPLDERDRMGGPFLGALALHVALIGGVAGAALLRGHAIPMGDKNAGAALMGITMVDSIPLQHDGMKNPLANNTDSIVPQAPVPEAPVKEKKQPKAKEEPPPKDVVKLRDKKAPPLPTKEAATKQSPKQLAQVTPTPNKFRPFEQLDPNQLTSKSAPAVAAPIYSASGGGQVGTMNSTLGDRFAAYAFQIREILARTWRTGDVDSWRNSAPPVVATFDISRDGSVHNIKLSQKSGVATLDASVERAIREAAFPELPRSFDKSSASVEFTFELKR